MSAIDRHIEKVMKASDKKAALKELIRSRERAAAEYAWNLSAKDHMWYVSVPGRKRPTNPYTKE